MKARAVMVQGALALAALGAAYHTWQRPQEVSQGDVTALDLSRRELTRVRFEKTGSWVELSPEELGGERAVSVKREEPAEKGKTPPSPRELVGNELAERVLDRFTPLLAERSLGVLGTEKLAELGLAKPERHLIVEARGASYRFDVSTALGAGQPYLRDTRSGNVYVLGGMLVSDLEMSARLVDRRLPTFQREEFDAVTVTAGGHSRSLVAIAQPSTYLPRLASTKSPATPDTFAKNWHDQLWRLAPVDLLGRGEVPQTGAPLVTVRVDYRRGGNDVGFVELGKSGADVYARSEHTAGWVKLGAQAASVLQDAERVASEE
jgi:hypothetical protein